jgi:hypothetical protein
MPPSNYERVSVYLSESEQAALARLARSFNTSKNGVIRILIRDAGGLPLPDDYLTQLRNKLPEPA